MFVQTLPCLAVNGAGLSRVHVHSDGGLAGKLGLAQLRSWGRWVGPHRLPCEGPGDTLRGPQATL